MKNFTYLTLLTLTFFITLGASGAPKLNSHPSAPATIYLDFDGHMVFGVAWNSGIPIFCAPSGLNDAEITEVFNRVAEDYRPFNVNITTDSTKFLSAPLNKRIRVIVTPTSEWTSGVGGISYIGSFTWGDDTPAFVFSDRLGPNNAKYIAECCSHESGHAVGLSHQSTYDANCNLTETYAMGSGTGQASWSPIMGNSYYRNMTGWNDGPTPYGCANTQDNLTIITAMNGFGYRADDYTDARNASTFAVTNTSFSVDGIITTSTDKDAFKYTLSQKANFHLNAIPFSVSTDNNGANLDIKVTLYNGETQVAVYDPVNSMSITIDTMLNAGTYYIVVDGAGNSNTSNYGSLGSYTITGFSGALPIHEIKLNGNTNKDKHELDWTIVADEPIRSVEVEVSKDGSFFTSLAALSGTTKQFGYTPSENTTLYYRLKVTSVINQTVYSNTIALKATGKTVKLFTVSTLVTNEIVVNAGENYRYSLHDINGRTIAMGNGLKGINKINVNNKSAGMYVIQLFANNTKQSERIIKQ